MKFSRSLLAVTGGILLSPHSLHSAAPSLDSFFPIGIFGVSKAENLRPLREAGFDTFVAYTKEPDDLKALAAEAKKERMKMVAYPDRLVSNAADRYASWPVLSWFLHDEPEVTGFSSQALDVFAKEVRAWDAGRPLTFVIGKGSAALEFGAIPDVLMLDWYPVPHHEMTTVAGEMAAARAAMKEPRPLWMVIQAFNWKDAPQHNPSVERVGRFPSIVEMRFMSYLAILHDARGLFYYTLRKPGDLTLFDYRHEWQAVARVVMEISKFKPVLERGEPMPLPAALVDPLQGKAWRFKGKIYIVLLNSGDEPVDLPPVYCRNEWRPLFRTRRHVREIFSDDGVSCRLPSKDVLVLEGIERNISTRGRGN